MADIRYTSGAQGNPVGVIMPIEIWHEIESEQETAYLTKSKAMKSVCSQLNNAVQPMLSFSWGQVKTRLTQCGGCAPTSRGLLH